MSKSYTGRLRREEWTVRTVALDDATLFNSIPESFCAFHWHSDTYDLPSGAIHLAQSDACKNQAFQIGHVLGS